jgi:hypothetical protein
LERSTATFFLLLYNGYLDLLLIIIFLFLKKISLFQLFLLGQSLLKQFLFLFIHLLLAGGSVEDLLGISAIRLLGLKENVISSTHYLI